MLKLAKSFRTIGNAGNAVFRATPATAILPQGAIRSMGGMRDRYFTHMSQLGPYFRNVQKFLQSCLSQPAASGKAGSDKPKKKNDEKELDEFCCEKKTEKEHECAPEPPYPRTGPGQCVCLDSDRSDTAEPPSCCPSNVTGRTIQVSPWCDDEVVKRKLRALREEFAAEAAAQCRARHRPTCVSHDSCSRDEGVQYRWEAARADAAWAEERIAVERLLDKEWAKAKEHFSRNRPLKRDMECKIVKPVKGTCGEPDTEKPRKEGFRSYIKDNISEE